MKIASVKCKSYTLALCIGAKLVRPVGPYIEVFVDGIRAPLFWECVDGSLTWPAGAA